MAYDTLKNPAKPAHDNPLSPNHYAHYKIQPLEFITQKYLKYLVVNIIKLVMRYDAENRVEDLKKARVYLDKLIENTEEKEKEKQC